MKHTSGKVRYAAYESGPMKFKLCRDLRLLGEDCGVVTVTTLGHSQKRRRHKTDASDARALLGDIGHEASKISGYWIPSEEAE